jgi:hypothetical protein
MARAAIQATRERAAARGWGSAGTRWPGTPGGRCDLGQAGRLAARGEPPSGGVAPRG